MNCEKINVSMSSELFNKLEAYRLEKNLTRSGAVQVALEDYFEALEKSKKEMLRLNAFASAFKDYTDGKITSSDFSSICKSLAAAS